MGNDESTKTESPATTGAPDGATPPTPEAATPPPAAEAPAPEVPATEGAAAPPEREASPTRVPTSMLGRAISELQEAQRTGHDRLLRMAADHENFKKRARREASDSMRRAEEKVVLEFLPILDNLERAVAHAQGTEAAVGGLLEGVRMVHKQFLAALERYEIRPFTSLGQPFDPERHEAIQQAPSPQPPGIICHEAQRGYLRGERLVRPAMVVVSIGPVTSAGSTAPAVEGSEGGASEASAAGSGTPETGQS